jgi:acetyl esterase/lipase
MPVSTHVIVLPGGGYQGHAPHEGEPVAEWLRGLGLESSVLLYPVRTKHPAPLDAVRTRVAELRAAGVERIGILGFSAGGHLAGHAAVSGLVDRAVLGYPVVSMVMATHGGSRANLVGSPQWPWRRAALSLELLVTPSTPPMFIWHTADDESVPVEHAYRLATALSRNGVSHAVHVYPNGKHGLGLAEGAGLPERWTAECEEWLRDAGWIG